MFLIHGKQFVFNDREDQSKVVVAETKYLCNRKLKYILYENIVVKIIGCFRFLEKCIGFYNDVFLLVLR